MSSVQERPVAPASGSRWLPSRGIRFMALGALWFSVMSLLVKVAGETLPTMQIVLVRAVISLVLSYWMVRRAQVDLWGSDRRFLLLRGALGFGALACFYYSVVNLPLAEATVIQYTNPVFTALLAAWLLKERIGAREASLVGLSVFGVLVMARPRFLFDTGGESLPLGIVAVALAGAMLSAGAYVTVRKLGSSEHPLVIVFYFPLIAVPATVPFVIPDAVWPAPWEWLVLLGVGITTQLGQVSMTRGLQLERAGRATAVGYLQIVFAATWGVIFFAEIPDRWTLAGALVIVGSTLALALSRPAELAGRPLPGR